MNDSGELVAKSGRKSFWRSLVAFLGELQRRKVVQTTTVYLVAAWGLSAGAADIFGALGLPDSAARNTVIAIFALTPFVAVASWLYEVNKRGIRRDYGPPDEQISRDTEVARRDTRAPLTLRYGDHAETFLRDVVVGRDDSCAFQIIEPLVSRRHVKFEFSDGHWYARDLGSANGTLLGGREIDQEMLEAQAELILYPDGAPLLVMIGGDAVSDETRISPSRS